MSDAIPMLAVDRLSTRFVSGGTQVRALEEVSFSIADGETVAIVGESGCGKSVTAMSILRLLPTPPARMTGSIRFRGRELMDIPEAGMQAIRGNSISMIFQEPMTSLNPVLSVGHQIAETLRRHQRLDRRAAYGRAIEMLAKVKIPEARRRASEYPHQLSGGMRQRVMIAMALACSPQLLVADEPTTALDVTMQAQILELMRELRDATGTAILLITHDLGVVADMAERVIVMYAGRIVETATIESIFESPAHHYTRGLLRALPRLGASLDTDTPDRLHEIPGVVPTLSSPIAGCAFAPRCPAADQRCREELPVLRQVGDGQHVSCHHPFGSAG
jgi:peptide/nickel transport system ATP-binding protein